jgi:PIN domain nuclease of toxin-antitoxin system
MILLDTHVVIWILSCPERISKGAVDAIAANGARGGRLGISTATIYELIYAKRRGRIEIHATDAELLSRMRLWFDPIPISETIAARASALSDSFHGDPMDRIIVSTAIVEDCVLITKDAKIRQANLCKVIW